jgi:transposase
LPGAEHGSSAREAEVLSLIAWGLTNQQIAEAPALSLNTVKTYIRTAYRKMGSDHSEGGGPVGYQARHVLGTGLGFWRRPPRRQI